LLAQVPSGIDLNEGWPVTLRIPGSSALTQRRPADHLDIHDPLVDDLAPQAIAHAVLGVAIAAYEHWLDDPASDLGALLDNAMRQLAGASARSSAKTVPG
jgi:MftR C-terminal domain